LKLEPAVGRTRVGRDALRWQCAALLHAPAREDRQRCERAAARLKRVCRALTQRVRVVVRREPIGTRIELNEIRWMQTTHSRLSAHGRHADVAAAGRRRRPRSPAHARGRPSRPAIRSCINTAVPCKHGGQPRIGPAPGGTTTALCIWRGVPRPRMRPGCQARWLGVRRRPNSRWPQPAHEQALLLARRLRSKQAAPRAWAGEPALGHLPCCTLARSLRRISASGRALRIVTGGAPDAQFGGRLSGGELSEASSASRP